MPTNFKTFNSNLLQREFPEVPLIAQDPLLLVRFDDMPQFGRFQAKVVTDFPAVEAWKNYGDRFGIYAIRDSEAFYIFRSNGLGELTVQKLCAYTKGVSDVANAWKQQLDDFYFEKALILETTPPSVLQARFWAYPTHGRNFRYLHLSMVQLKDENLLDRAIRGKFAEWRAS